MERLLSGEGGHTSPRDGVMQPMGHQLFVNIFSYPVSVTGTTDICDTSGPLILY